jgi:hypothetical protein
VTAVTGERPIEDVTDDGFRIRRENKRDMMLEFYYLHYNKQYFNGRLPFFPVFWAKSIKLPDGGHANALCVSADSSVKHGYIVIDETLSDMFPLERLCLLHEMVHVSIGPELGHGPEFIAEFKRVLDADKWNVMGCTDPNTPTPVGDDQNIPQSLEGEQFQVNQLKDEFSTAPVTCPKCGKVATSVHKTGNKAFYNHGDAKAEYKDGQLHAYWKSCETDRPMPKKKS